MNKMILSDNIVRKLLQNMSDQIANELVNELVGEATNDFRRRRVSWYDEVEAEEAPGASGSTEHAQGASIAMGGQVRPVMQHDIRYPHPEGAFIPGVSREPGETAAAPRGRGYPHPLAAPLPVQIVREVVTQYIVMAEPYPNWRDTLVSLFRNLTPTKVAGGSKWQSGYVARVVNSGPDGPYLIGARYNINGNPGAPPFNWGRVVESLIRGMSGNMERAPESGDPLPFTSGREKANCGVQIRVAIKPLPGALGI